MEVVLAPDWRKNGQLIYALVGAGATVFGLFANGDGSDAKLLQLGTAADTVSGLASFDGSTIVDPGNCTLGRPGFGRIGL
jgi:hypothetical protein